MKSLVKLSSDLLHGVAVRRRRLEREVFPILLHCGRATIQILMRKDREVEQRGGIIRLRPQRRVELQVGLLVTAAVCLDQSLAVPCFGRARVELERLVKTFFRGLELARAQLGGSQFSPAVGQVRLKAGVTG